MTNFKPLKEKIWEDVKRDDKSQFDKDCQALMDKAVGDWWRIGWDVFPKNINDVVEMFNNLAKESDKAWKAAMQCGDAPHEDISPAEGFLLCAKHIKDAIEKNEKTSVK